LFCRVFTKVFIIAEKKYNKICLSSIEINKNFGLALLGENMEKMSGIVEMRLNFIC